MGIMPPFVQKKPEAEPSPATAPSPVRRAPAEAIDTAEPRSLVTRLSEEVAALRRALEASHRRIAALEIEVAEDHASGLLNRNAFRREIEKAIAFQSRYRMLCGVALIDVLGIGALNAAEGHAAGNAALRMAADTLRSAIRSCDVAARADSEQFGVVLWNSDESECRARLERALDEIGALPLAVEIRFGLRMITPGATPEALLDALERDLPDSPLRR